MKFFCDIHHEKSKIQGFLIQYLHYYEVVDSSIELCRNICFKVKKVLAIWDLFDKI